MTVACLLLFAMTLLIGGDVLTRNIGLGGIAWSNEVSENILYLLTLLLGAVAAAPGPAHPRRHSASRRAGARSAGCSNGSATCFGFACSVYFVWYGCKVLAASYLAGAVTIKTLVTPEWWLLAPCRSRSCWWRSSSSSACSASPKASARRAPTRCRSHDLAVRRSSSCSAARPCCCCSACRSRFPSSRSTSSARCCSSAARRGSRRWCATASFR